MCERIKWTLLSGHGNVRRSDKPKCATKYGVYHTWERTWPIGNESQLKAICSVTTILINRPINNLLNFIFRGSLKPSLFISSDPNGLLQIGNQQLFYQSFNQVISLHSKLAESYGNAFSIAHAVSVSLSPTVISLLQTSVLSHSRVIQKKLFCLFLYVAEMLFFQQSNYLHFFTILLPNNRICYARMTFWSTKMFLEIYFVIRCEAKFS